MSLTTQDFEKRLDLTALTQVSGTEINQVLETALPADNKGLIIQTTDTALNIPEVPNPNVEFEGVTPTHWTRYIWLRIPFDETGVIKIYAWNPHIDADVTLLNWQLQFDVITLEAAI